MRSTYDTARGRFFRESINRSSSQKPTELLIHRLATNTACQDGLQPWRGRCSALGFVVARDLFRSARKVGYEPVIGWHSVSLLWRCVSR